MINNKPFVLTNNFCLCRHIIRVFIINVVVITILAYIISQYIHKATLSENNLYSTRISAS